MSKRTDGGPSQPMRVPAGGAYGDATQLQQTEQGAPMGATPGGDQAMPASLLAGLSIPTGPGFGEPTQQPDVPVTDGAAGGPGAGPEALGLPVQQDQDMQALQAYLPVLEHMANQPGASAAARNMVRAIKGQVGA
ncbi:MAG: hypothetical protein ACTHON_15075 [Humibacter sp.]